MHYLNLSPELQLAQAQERVETLHREASVYRLTRGQSWQKVLRKRVADDLVRVAGWLEPTPAPSNPSVLDSLSTNLSK